MYVLHVCAERLWILCRVLNVYLCRILQPLRAYFDGMWSSGFDKSDHYIQACKQADVLWLLRHIYYRTFETAIIMVFVTQQLVI